MKTTKRSLAQALEDVLPYVESRLEDMRESAYGARPEHRVEARHYYARALVRFRAAERALRLAWREEIEKEKGVEVAS